MKRIVLVSLVSSVLAMADSDCFVLNHQTGEKVSCAEYRASHPSSLIVPPAKKTKHAGIVRRGFVAARHPLKTLKAGKRVIW